MTERDQHHLVREADLPRAEAERADRAAHARAREVDARRERLVAASTGQRRAMGRPGGMIVLVAGAWLIVAEGWAFPNTPEGHWGPVEAGLAGTALVAVGLRALVAEPSRLQAGVALAVGVVALLFGLLADPVGHLRFVGVTSGVTAVLAALLLADG